MTVEYADEAGTEIQIERAPDEAGASRTEDEASAVAQSAEAAANAAAEGTASQSDEGTAGEDAGEAGKAEAGKEGQADEPSEAVKAAIKAAATKLAIDLELPGDFETIEDVLAAATAAEDEAQEGDVAQVAESFYAEAARELSKVALGIEIDAYDAVGNAVKVKLAPEQAEKLFGPLDDFTGKVRRLEQTENFNVLGDQALDAIPKEQHAAFLEAIKGKDGKGMSLGEWLGTVLEYAAPTSKAWKKREADFGVEKAAHGEAKWKEGNRSPTGQATAAAGKGASAGGRAYVDYVAASDEDKARWTPAEIDAAIKAQYAGEL